MHRLLWKWLVSTLALLMLPHLFSGVRVESFGAALATAAVLGVLNTLVRPVLILLTLPLTLVTLGLFIFVLNALLFQAAAAFVPGVQFASFWSALAASVVVSAVNWVLEWNGPRLQVHSFRSPPRQPSGKRVGDDQTIDLNQREKDRWE